ncbi:TetR/AcrR family transcriptional regulator [Candidatus Sumerlaeota bacterium]|nr:TetR/AcrR family transcriptional regulator [Candidatus Sumerlaeota bacterium]
MDTSQKTARFNQKARTRKDLLLAASRLLKRGRNPTLEEIAEEALVSRATAYRYFPSVEALHLEAALHIVLPEPGELFREGTPRSATERVQLVDDTLQAIITANEASLRMMIAHSMERAVRGEGDGAAPLRQNRRTPMIEAALKPFGNEFDPNALDRLKKILCVIIGPEAMIAFKDVLQLSEGDSRSVRAWAIQALVDAAQIKPPNKRVARGKQE